MSVQGATRAPSWREGSSHSGSFAPEAPAPCRQNVRDPARAAPAASLYFTGRDARQQWPASGLVLRRHTRPLRRTLKYQRLTLSKTHNVSQRKPTEAKAYFGECLTE